MNKLKNPPVFYTLAQVKFNTISLMSEYVPKLQDKLRRTGYADFEEENFYTINVRQPDRQISDIKQNSNMRWHFRDSARNEGYLLLSDSLVFHTTIYETFDIFLSKLILGLKIIHEIIELNFIDRTGLRYLNAVIPGKEETLANYLTPSLLGFSSIADKKLEHTFIETVSQNNSGTLIARSVIKDNALALPPDLLPFKLQISPRFSEILCRTAVLDTDHFISHHPRFEFNIAPIKSALSNSHDILTEVFRSSITEHAIKVWGL